MTEKTILKPVNGVLWGNKCKRRINDPDAYWGDRVSPAELDGAKVGDRCPLCKRFEADQYYTSYATCKVEVLKSTIIGPVHAVESTGNPLIDAAAILRVDGWVAGNWVCEEGKKCLAGAVRAACGILPEPESEGSDFAQKYVTKKWYVDGKRKSARALITLALEIYDTDHPRPKKEDFKGDAWRYRNEVYSWEEERNQIKNDIDLAVEVVTQYNDGVLKRKAKRKGAIELLERAAAKFSPRMKLGRYEY